ncbi:hypothetical protein D9619_008381 [Psilocybe cf. subviscida]|uniref:Uncharacterized protein n=1 Tax=Psilocybe cf. subviscida TaxID=2480587 RepID=A0A8H5F0S8_9AGAR|nr:hypothetical protein D9619_008381 [Psilocybe cf. subviscida]
MSNYHRSPPTREKPAITRAHSRASHPGDQSDLEAGNDLARHSRHRARIPGGFEETDHGDNTSHYADTTISRPLAQTQLPGELLGPSTEHGDTLSHHDSGEGDLDILLPSEDENFRGIEEYLNNTNSPSPSLASHSIPSDDEIHPSTNLNHPIRARTLSSSSSSSLSSLSDTDDDLPGITMADSTRTQPEESFVIGLSKAKDIPVLADGKRITPANVYAWARAVRQCKLRNKFTEQDAVEQIGGSFQSQFLADWFDANSTRLIAAGVDSYLTEFAAYVLDDNWARDVHGQILSSRQGAKPFKQWYVEMSNLNNILGMAPAGASVKKLSEDSLRAQLAANLTGDLRDYLNDNGTVDGITDVHKWALAVDKADTHLRRERARNAAQTASLLARMNMGGAAMGTAKPKKSLAERISTPAPSGSNNNPATPSLKKLTDPDKALLDEHKGCRRCRLFYAGHATAECPMAKAGTWPDPATLAPLTLETALAAKKRVPAGAALYTLPRDLEVRDDDEYYERLDWGDEPMDEDAELEEEEVEPADIPTDSCVSTPLSPLTLPHLVVHATIPHAMPSHPPVRIQALIDVGCPSAVISGTLAARLGLKRFPLPPGEDNLEDLSQSPLESTHFVRTSFTAAGWKSEEFEAKVIEKLHVPMLLGIPFLHQHHIVIDVRAGTAVDTRVNMNIARLPAPTSKSTGGRESAKPSASPASPLKVIHKSKNSTRPAPTTEPLPPQHPLPPLAGVTNPAPLLAAIRERIETLTQQERCSLRRCLTLT